MTKINEITPVITMDGPGGSGKGTLSQMLAQKLKWHLLDSGALYRVLALAVNSHHVDPEDEVSLELLAVHLDVQFQATGAGMPCKVILEGEDVSEQIRSEKIGNLASQVSHFRRVRRALLQRQRHFRRAPGLVADGRDMGTVVFPEALLKFYLTASCEERAKRRHLQLKEKGISANISALTQKLEERDARDENREASPLRPADNALIVDTSALSISQVFDEIWTHVEACKMGFTSAS
jgi:CMP/dCMP kinase